MAEQIDDKTRIDNIIQDIFSNNKKMYSLDEKSKDILIEYVEEVVHSVLEDSCLLARHRASKVVEVSDVQLILLKKFGIEVPGFGRLPSLHSSTISSSKPENSTISYNESTDMSIIERYDGDKPKKSRKKRKQDSLLGDEVHSTENKILIS
jgi:transcription initiation factor TFIID subunit TAF12